MSFRDKDGAGVPSTFHHPPLGSWPVRRPRPEPPSTYFSFRQRSGPQRAKRATRRSCHPGRATGFAPRGHPGSPGLATNPGRGGNQGREPGLPRAPAPRTAVSPHAEPPARPSREPNKRPLPRRRDNGSPGTHPGGEAGLETVPSPRRSSLSRTSLSGATLDCQKADALRHFRRRKSTGGRCWMGSPDEEQG